MFDWRRLHYYLMGIEHNCTASGGISDFLFGQNITDFVVGFVYIMQGMCLKQIGHFLQNGA